MGSAKARRRGRLDDVVRKPVHVCEMLARMKAMPWRAHMQGEATLHRSAAISEAAPIGPSACDRGSNARVLTSKWKLDLLARG